MIRIANGQGFWGDWLEAPVRLIEGGPIDYLTLDYLAEVTMSVLQKQRQADPALGYARDFPLLMGRVGRQLRERGVRVVANAGGVNPRACAAMVRKLAPELKVAVVEGDDVLGRLGEFLEKGYALANLDTGRPVTDIAGDILSANVYLGAFPIAEALASGADVVITGRCADAALALGPMVHAFGWRPADHDLLAAGCIGGHIIECGSHATGGNTQVNWQGVPDLANIGYPILEVDPDGGFSVTKHAGTGGRVECHIVMEQMLYEIGDPRAYLTPDCTADFTSCTLSAEGPDRVRVTGCRGGPAPEMLKVSISYHAGWKAVGTLVYCWPEAVAKARAADAILRQRLEGLGLPFEEIYSELFGLDACHGPAAAPAHEPPEVMLRAGVRSASKQAVERFTRELIPLVLSGPPSATGYGEGRPPVREVVAYWPALLAREEVVHRIEVFQ
jgi:hypothetical protein